MVTWAGRTPLSQWPGSPEALARGTGNGVLVDAETRHPTQACLEWAMAVADVPAELFENVVIDDALASCRAARSPAAYTAFRRLLITRPVLTAVELAALGAELDLMPVFEVIRRCYEPAPAAYRGPRRQSGSAGGAAACWCPLRERRLPLRAGPLPRTTAGRHRAGYCGRAAGCSS